MTMQLTLGETILIERRRRNMTIAELARLVDVSPATISNYEYGRTTINAEKLLEICSVLNISIDVVDPKTEEKEEPESIFPEDNGVYIEDLKE